MSFSSPTSPAISYQGLITFLGAPDSTRPPQSTLLPLPKGTYYVLLCGTTLHLHRGNPFLDLEGKKHDGAEVARLKVDQRGWTVARRRSTADGGVSDFELAQEPELELGETGKGNVLSRKISSPSLASVRESPGGEKEGGARPRFVDKFALRKRIKSVSTTSSIFGGTPAATRAPIDEVEPLVMHAAEAGRWIDAINSALAPLQISLPSPLPTPRRSISSSASFSSFSITSTPLQITSRRPLAPGVAPIVVPSDFNPGRRPSFLDRPPPSPRSYVNSQAPASSPPREGEELATSSSKSTVPAWLQAVRSSGSTATRISRSASTSLPQVKSKRSVSSLSSSAGAPSTSMERSRSDGSRPSLDSDFGSSEGSRTGRLLGFLGRKSSKGSDGPSTASSSTRRTSGPLYSQGTQSTSSISLTDSIPSESHSASVCSNDVHLRTTPQLASALDLASPLPPRSSLSSLRGFWPGPQPSTTETKGHTRRTGSDGASTSSRSPYLSAEDYRASDAASTPTRRGGSQGGTSERREASLSTLEGPVIEHIVKPAHLISQMRDEVEQRSRGAQRELHFAPLRAGLSPPPRNMSRQNLSSLAANRLAKSHSTASFLPSSPSTRAGRVSLDELAGGSPRRELGSSSSPETPKGRRSSFGRTLVEDAIPEGDATVRYRVASNVPTTP